MALLTYNGTNFDTMIGSAAITVAGVAVTTVGVTSSGVTAPNLTNKVTGAWIWISAPPSSGNYLVDLMESGVQKATATINFADLKAGMNYVRFATPYQFATLTALAYACRVRHSGVGSGQVSSSGAGLWFQFTYDLTVAAPTTTYDVWIGGFHDSGLTPKTYVPPTGSSWGTGALTTPGNTSRFVGGAIQIGNGGTLSRDQTVSTTLQFKGSVFVTHGGLFDNRAPSNKAVVVTTIIDGAANGDQGLFTATTTIGGQILTRGATYDIYTKYVSGLGTAASPMIVSIPWDADVGDEIVIGGATDYLKNEVRYIKTRNSSTSFVLSATPGGVESALANTHAVGAHIANLQRNSIIKALVNTRGWYAGNYSTNSLSDFSYTRMEYSDSTSGKSLTLNPNNLSTYDGLVLYQASITGRACLIARQNDTTPQTHTGIILYNMGGSNFSGQSGIGLSGTTNKTFVDCFQFNAPSSIFSCALFSLSGSSTANVFNNCHSYGGNSVNSSAGYVIGLFSSSGNTFNNCSVNAARQNATYFAASSGNIFNNCNFGNMGVNGNDATCLTGTLNQALFNACSFTAPSLITNYLNQLDTSLISFQDMDGNTSKHRWYTNYGSWWSAGAGLTDTTVRTVGSLSVVSKPENNSVGSSWTFKIPAAPASSVSVLGYVQRNALFSSGTLKVELFLPGTLLTATPDATYTFPTTTGSWLPFNIAAYYAGSVARYATVRITGVTSTAGAYFFVDDLYDAGTNNKVAGLDLWDAGQPSPVMVVTDFSSAVPVISDAVRQAVWNDTSQYALNAKGGLVADTNGLVSK